MNLTRTRLLASVAGLITVTSAHAADLPVRRAAPVEFVRVCNAYGAGFFYIPGTDTCLRISGRARFQMLYQTSHIRNGSGGDSTGYQGLARFNFDARTQTAYGTLRAFVRMDLAQNTGPFIVSLSRQRQGLAVPALGADAFGRDQTFVNADKAFIQFAGLTAGRASSFYDFYAHDFELIGNSLNSDVYSTNLLAYTATFGNGFSATISAEDPTNRRQPIFGTAAAVNAYSAASGFGGLGTAFAPFGAGTLLAPIVVAPGVVAFQDVTQKNRMPDFVGVLRYDSAWGSAQLSAAVHEINGGSAISTQNIGTAVTNLTGISPTGRAPNEYGFAVQGGLKVNLPVIAAGDALYLQGSYAKGALSYTGYQMYTAPYDALAAAPVGGGSFLQYFADAVLNPATGRYELSESFTVVASMLHYWSPEWRSAFYGSYGEVTFGKAGRNELAVLGFGFTPIGTAAGQAAYAYSNTLRDNNMIVAGANLIWSPVKDLDIGVEGAYIRTALNSGKTIDITKGALGKLISSEDDAQFRFRVQRDF